MRGPLWNFSGVQKRWCREGAAKPYQALPPLTAALGLSVVRPAPHFSLQ